MNVRWIWFDLGYTLLYLNREVPFRQLLLDRGFDRSLQEIETAFHLNDKLFMREFPGVLGKSPGCYIPWYHGLLLHNMGIHTDLPALFNDWKKFLRGPLESWHPFPFVQEILARLRHEGYRLGIISNWDQSARKILDKHGLTPYFESIVISSEAGVEKPAREIFLTALESAGTDPEICLYVGDNFYDDYVGSKSAGMNCVIINRFGNLGIEELPECTIIQDIRSLPCLLLPGTGSRNSFQDQTHAKL